MKEDAVSTDSFVRCDKCGREERANFAICLSKGWPKCDGYTMRLVSTDADIDAAVKTIFATPLLSRRTP